LIIYDVLKIKKNMLTYVMYLKRNETGFISRFASNMTLVLLVNIFDAISFIFAKNEHKEIVDYVLLSSF